MLQGQLHWHSTIQELIHYSPEILISAVSWLLLSELSVTFTWSKQENKDVAGSEESEKYHPTNKKEKKGKEKKRLLPLLSITLTVQHLCYNIVSNSPEEKEDA